MEAKIDLLVQLAVQHLCSLPWERHSRELLESWLVLVTPADSCKLGGSLTVSAGLCRYCWFTFDFLILLNWTAGILTTEIGIAPKELLLNRSTNPFPINHLSLLPLVGRIEGRLKHLRILLTKVCFEKSKPTFLSILHFTLISFCFLISYESTCNIDLSEPDFQFPASD